MFDVFKMLVKAEGPDYILDSRSVSCGQLRATTCMYAKNKKFYTATTFYTDVWIGKSPLSAISGDIHVAKSLGDIAIIQEFGNMQMCRSSPCVTVQDLQDVLDKMNSEIDTILDGMVHPELGDVVHYQINLSPVPSVLITVSSKQGLVGTMAIFADGHVLPIMVCDQRMVTYIERTELQIVKKRFKFGGTVALPASAGNVSPMTLGGE